MKEEKTRRIHFYKAMYFDKEFEETLVMFEKMIGEDKFIIDTIPEKTKMVAKKNGYFSYAVRYIIQKYVDNHKDAYIKKHAKQTKEITNDTVD
jgi:hypothetical protein